MHFNQKSIILKIYFTLSNEALIYQTHFKDILEFKFWSVSLHRFETVTESTIFLEETDLLNFSLHIC
jgi:hypothetical protein